jgi:hypothetical protein
MKPYELEIEWSSQLRRHMPDPRCQTMATIGIISLGLTAVSMGVSYSGALNPDQPDLASSSRELSNANAQLLPLRRGMESAAARGVPFTFTLPAGINGADYGFTAEDGGTMEQVLVGGQWVPFTGQTAEAGKQLPKRTVQSLGDGRYTVDFTGYGTADTQGELARQAAANSLALSQKYDSQFIDSALEQEKLADPEGFAARARMHELVKEQADQKPDRPVAELLNRQVGDQLKAGRGLDAFDKAALDKAVTESTGARGGAGEGADFERTLTTGYAGEQRAQNARRKALAFETSGATPEDVEYRRSQQTMANLSSMINGQTPQSQFASLSGAQRGPTPQVNGNPLPVMPGNTSAVAGAAASTRYGQQIAQPNQWMAGLSALLTGANAAGNAGWKPIGG